MDLVQIFCTIFLTTVALLAVGAETGAEAVAGNEATTGLVVAGGNRTKRNGFYGRSMGSPRDGFNCFVCIPCDGKNQKSVICSEEDTYCGVRVKTDGSKISVSRGCVPQQECIYAANEVICGCQGNYCNKGGLIGNEDARLY